MLLLLFSYSVLVAQEKHLLTDINYVTSYGQSLSVGWTAIPIISTKQKYNNIMFKGGVRLSETSGDRLSFTPLIESISGDRRRGETPISGVFDYFTQIYGKDNNIRFLGTASGVGGISIEGLKKGTNPFNSIKEDLIGGKRLCDKNGDTFSMPFFVWTQGETDQLNNRSIEWYKKEMSTLIKDIDALAKSVTNQKNDVYCFGYQMSTHLIYHKSNPTDRPDIALAQLEMALCDSSNYIMTTPMYPFNYSNDGVHLTAQSSKLYGAYVGYVSKKVIVDGVKWKPIHATNYSVKHKRGKWSVTVDFSVPVSPLVIDTVLVTNPESLGFSIVKSTGEKINIESIRVSKKKSLIFNLKESPINATLRYGMTHNEYQKSSYTSGARGCIRDSQGDKIKVIIAGKEYKMYNWLPFFELNIN